MKKFMTVLLSGFLAFSAVDLSAHGEEISHAAGSYYSSTHIHWLSNYSDAIREAQASSKPILILFTGTNWCPACQKLERDALSKPEFAQAIGNRFVFLKINIQRPEDAVLDSPYKTLIDRYGIEAYPSMIVVDANGQKLFSVNYRSGGPDIYARELIQRLNQPR